MTLITGMCERAHTLAEPVERRTSRKVEDSTAVWHKTQPIVLLITAIRERVD
ncbi:MAG: hypothetical protein WAN17_05425 [Candidatus Sulfotelmatobacter sp.]